MSARPQPASDDGKREVHRRQIWAYRGGSATTSNTVSTVYCRLQWPPRCATLQPALRETLSPPPPRRHRVLPPLAPAQPFRSVAGRGALGWPTGYWPQGCMRRAVDWCEAVFVEMRAPITASASAALARCRTGRQVKAQIRLNSEPT